MKVEVEKVLEKIVEYAVYGLVFSIPFSKAAIEVFGITAIVGWVILGLIRFARDDKGSTPLLWALGLAVRGAHGTPPPGDFLRSLDISSSVASSTKTIVKRPIYMALTAFLVVNLISCITSVAIGHSISAFFTKTLEYALFFIIIASVFSDYKKLKTLFMVMLVSVTLAYINGMVQYFTGFDLVRRDGLVGRAVSGSLINPNDFGNYVIMFIPLLLGLSTWKKLILRYRILIISVLLISLFCLILSNSRAALIGFSIAMLFFGFMKGKRFFLSTVLILLIGLFFLAEPIKEKTEIASSVKGVTVDVRISLWEEALSVIKDYPITGAGLNTYSMIAPKYKVHPLGGTYAHNSYLQMAAETGLVGLGAFLWFLWTVFNRGLSLFKRAQEHAITDYIYHVLILGLVAGLIGFLVNAFFDTTLFALRLVTLFWVMAGVLAALCNIAENQYNKSTKT